MIPVSFRAIAQPRGFVRRRNPVNRFARLRRRLGRVHAPRVPRVLLARGPIPRRLPLPIRRLRKTLRLTARRTPRARMPLETRITTRPTITRERHLVVVALLRPEVLRVLPVRSPMRTVPAIREARARTRMATVLMGRCRRLPVVRALRPTRVAMRRRRRMATRSWRRVSRSLSPSGATPRSLLRVPVSTWARRPMPWLPLVSLLTAVPRATRARAVWSRVPTWVRTASMRRASASLARVRRIRPSTCWVMRTRSTSRRFAISPLCSVGSCCFARSLSGFASSLPGRPDHATACRAC